MFTLPSKYLRVLCLALLSPLLFIQAAHAQPTSPPKEGAKQAESSVLLRWQGKPGVERYRLQLATDAGFNDIIYDQAVVGRQHLVKGLALGKYYWRVAPAARETGAFSSQGEVEVTASSGVEVPNVIIPADTGGWRTATGEVLRPVAAHLRAGTIIDLVGVNKDGTVYAIDGANGIALWTARFRPLARGAEQGSGKVSFISPILIQRQDVTSSVVVAFDGGVRALKGDAGREVWRANLEGRPASGSAGDLNGDGSPEVVVVTEDPNKMYVLDGSTGHTLAEKKLDSEVVGAPYMLAVGEQRGVALALKSGALEIRGADGNVLREVKLGSEVTTAPLAVRREQMALIVVGTKEGLVALSVGELKVLGRIVPESDEVRGTLTAADLDNDGAMEIVMLTKRGRVALVSTVDGNVKWYAEGATDAEAAAFADVNADGVLDVIVPGGAAFAVGYSGRDGALVWKVEETGGKSQAGVSADAPARALVVVPSLNGGGIIAGSDPARVGLRAVELPKGAVRKAVAGSQ